MIPILRSQQKRPDWITIGKSVPSMRDLNESVAINSITALFTDSVIYNKPTKRGDESLCVSKMSAEVVSIIETDEEGEGMELTQQHLTLNRKKQN